MNVFKVLWLPRKLKPGINHFLFGIRFSTLYSWKLQVVEFALRKNLIADETDGEKMTETKYNRRDLDLLDDVIESTEDAEELEILLRIKKLTPAKRNVLFERLNKIVCAKEQDESEKTQGYSKWLSEECKELRHELLDKSLRLGGREKITALDKKIDELAVEFGMPDLRTELDQSILNNANGRVDPYEWMDREELYGICQAKSRIIEQIEQCKSLEKIKTNWHDIISELAIYPEKYEKADVSSSKLPKRIEEINAELESKVIILKDFKGKEGWPRVISHPSIRAGRPILEGSRWGANELAEMVELEGIDVMLEEYEGITRPMIYAAQEFAKEFPDAVDNPNSLLEVEES